MITQLSAGHKSYIAKLVASLGHEPTEVDLKLIAGKVKCSVAVLKSHLFPESIEGKDAHIRLLERLLLEKEGKIKSLEAQRKNTLRYENAVDTIREVAAEYCAPMKALPSALNLGTAGKTHTESLVMHWSDEHADQVVLPHRVNNLENYNLSVALRRAENYVQRTLDFAKNTLNNYNFPTLWILFYGDHVNGAIHGGTNESTLRNDFANAMAVGQLHALAIRDLASHFEQVKCIYVPGNHGRQAQYKEYAQALRNLDYLVGETSASLCRELTNVEFLIPDSYSVNVEIEGYTFNIAHGDDINAVAGIPWYGIERRNRRLQSIHSAKNQTIHYKVMGHWHTAVMMQNTVGESIINGSWKATDEYLYNKGGYYAEPVQWIHGVNEKHGVTWRLPVQLRSKDDINGPHRYRVKFASQDMNVRVNKFI